MKNITKYKSVFVYPACFCSSLFFSILNTIVLSESNDLEINDNPINHATSFVDIDSACTIARIIRSDR